MFVPWNPYMNMNMGMPGMAMPGMGMSGMGMPGMGMPGMGMAGMGMGGSPYGTGMGGGSPYGTGGLGGVGMTGTSAGAAGGGTAGQRAPRTAWGEEGPGPEEGPAGAPDAYALLDENFRAQLLSLRLAAARHRKALQETYLAASRPARVTLDVPTAALGPDSRGSEPS